jgi:hypothetical protein
MSVKGSTLQEGCQLKAVPHRKDVSYRQYPGKKMLVCALLYTGRLPVYAVPWQENVQHLAKRKGRMCAGRCYDL